MAKIAQTQSRDFSVRLLQVEVNIVNNLKVFTGIKLDEIKNVKRLEFDVDGIKYNLVPMANGWVEITVNGRLLVDFNPNSSTININIEQA